MNVNFCGKNYPILHIYINDYGYKNIAPESLEAKLIQNDRYVNKEAQLIDETIFFFAPDVLFVKGENETQEKIEHDVRNFVEHNVTRHCITDSDSEPSINVIINNFRNINSDMIDDCKYQEILERTAKRCNTSAEVILSCLELPNNTDFKSYISEETVKYPMPEENEPENEPELKYM